MTHNSTPAYAEAPLTRIADPDGIYPDAWACRDCPPALLLARTWVEALRPWPAPADHDACASCGALRPNLAELEAVPAGVVAP